MIEKNVLGGEDIFSRRGFLYLNLNIRRLNCNKEIETMKKYCVSVNFFDFVEAKTEDEAFAKATDNLHEYFRNTDDVDCEVSKVFQVKN